MSIRVKISSLLLKYTNGQEIVEVNGSNTLVCLHSLESHFPKIGKWLFNKTGELQPEIWLFVNGERIYTDDLTKPLNNGDELQILLAIIGG